MQNNSRRVASLHLARTLLQGMTVTPVQKSAIEDVVDALKKATSPKKKRSLSQLFLELVDKDSWANYYEARIWSAYMHVMPLTALHPTGHPPT